MTVKTAAEWAKALNMQKHPEGGYYMESYRSSDIVKSNKGNDVALCTSIYFILEDTNPSNFHRIASDELWYFHEGQSLTIHCIYPDGEYKAVRLGKDVENGEVLQFAVPKGVIFGSSVDTGFALVGCMVAPGFVFEEFELFKYDELVSQYPQHQDIIRKLTVN
ncbi:hypothetical protein PSN45_001210 [Yamadazyma tenuis]|uniref:uncharacterized protein n=1 Tax=Candida tenuis TaxID=2315449 RepID=UPI002799AB87|nr:hypothetical protein PSN45_001210 [Yamadazyma tenuis]